jgi:glyoxylase-like metal-dependent hydrolase (beta-lactamase superfamily II)
MKRILTLAAVALIAAAPRVSAQSNDLVKRAVAAEGGEQALRNVKSLALSGEATEWEPEQSMVAGGPPRQLGKSTISIRWDLSTGAERADFDHTMLYPFPGEEKYTEIATPDWGAVIEAKGPRPMSGARLAFTLREMERASPVLLLTAIDHPESVKALPNQKLDGKSLPAISLADGATNFIILFDPKTHLPADIRTVEDDYIHGDGHYDLMLAGWKPVDGTKVTMPTSLHYTFNGLDKLKIDWIAAAGGDKGMTPDSFAVDDAVRQAAKPPATGDLPWQAILGSQLFGRDDDLQAEKVAGEGIGMKLVEIAPNIQQATGRSHNSLVVNMPDYLVVFDAPLSEAQSRWTIDAAKAKYPGKPIKYLVLTHHHMDHVGGARTYVAEGVTVVVAKGDKAHMLKVFGAPHTMHPDALQSHKVAAKVIEVNGHMALKDGGKEIDVYDIPNLHVKGMLIGYVLPEKLVWVTDLYSPGRDKAKNPQNADFYAQIKKLGLAPAWYAGGHGTFGPAADFDAIMASK